MITKQELDKILTELNKILASMNKRLEVLENIRTAKVTKTLDK